LPAKPWTPETNRTDPTATVDDWLEWRRWIATLYQRRMRLCTDAFTDANRGNPRYGGAIWFQNAEWVGLPWGCDLDLLCQVPGISYFVCEYCTDPWADIWQQFRYWTSKHNKKLSSFVNLGYYSPDAPGRLRFEGSDEGFRKAVRMGVDESVDMIALYHSDALVPSSPAYHAERTRIWDEVTRPYCGLELPPSEVGNQ